MELFAWWNLIYILPFLTALLYLAALSFGLVAAEHGAQADADADADLDHDVDLDHDIGIDHDVDADHDIGLEHGGELHDAHASSPFDHAHDAGGNDGFLKLLGFLGVGRIPLSVLLMSFCFLWGFIGWASNKMLGAIIPAPALFIWPSLLLTALGSIFLTRWLAFGIGRIMPATENYGASNDDLLNRRGEVRFMVTEQSGTACLYDKNGNLHQEPCRIQAGEEPIPPGSRVLLYKYDDQRQVFYVCLDPLNKKSPGSETQS